MRTIRRSSNLLLSALVGVALWSTTAAAQATFVVVTVTQNGALVGTAVERVVFSVPTIVSTGDGNFNFLVSATEVGAVQCAGDPGCAAGAATRWVFEVVPRGPTEDAQGQFRVTLEIQAPAELCHCVPDPSYATQQCCGTMVFIAEGPMALRRHVFTMDFLTPAAAALRGCFRAATAARLGNDARIGGSLGVNDPSGRLIAGRGAFLSDGTELIASLARLGVGASVFDVSANEIRQSRNALVRGAISTPNLPFEEPFCPDPPAPCGTSNVVVPSGRDFGTLSPGAYGDLVIRDGGSIGFPAGAFRFCSVTTGRHAAIRVGAGATVDVSGDMRLGNATIFARQNLAAAPPTAVSVGGSLLRFGADAAVDGVFAAPNATVTIGRDAVVVGRLCGRLLRSDKGIRLGCVVE